MMLSQATRRENVAKGDKTQPIRSEHALISPFLGPRTRLETFLRYFR